MCLIAFAINASSRWPLVIAANRDEFFDRPSLPLARWTSASGHTIFSGRDLRGGGTWLGATPGGRVALLTNVREINPPLATHSRGELVMRWLDGDMDASRFMASTDSSTYGGFNLVLGDLRAGQWTWLANRRFDRSPNNHWPDRPEILSAGAWHSQPLANGVYALSNAALDTPWPKSTGLKQALVHALQAPDETALSAPLWTGLANRTLARPENLPDTGLPAELEVALSSACISQSGRGEQGYGTRCSTLLVVGALDQTATPAWTVSMTERTLAPPGPNQAGPVGNVRIDDVWQTA